VSNVAFDVADITRYYFVNGTVVYLQKFSVFFQIFTYQFTMRPILIEPVYRGQSLTSFADITISFHEKADIAGDEVSGVI
jgi:hypothetical protein